MKNKHTVLKERYMVNQPVYSDIDKLKLSKKIKRFSKKCVKKYGFPSPYMHDESISLACMLIELLSLYRDNTVTPIDRVACYIPDADWWFHNRTAEEAWNKAITKINDMFSFDSLDKPNATQADFTMKCRMVSLQRMIHLIIKGCRIYLSNGHSLSEPTKIDEQTYKQYCKSIGQPYKHLSDVGRDDGFDEYCYSWLTYALLCLAFNAPLIWDWVNKTL